MNTRRVSRGMRVLMGAGCGLWFAGGASAAELSLTLGNQAVSDPSFGIFGEDAHGMGMLGVEGGAAVGKVPGLHWIAGWEFGSVSDAAEVWDEGSTTVESRLTFHALDVGLRYDGPAIGLLTPYAGLGGRGLVGVVRLEDDFSSWSVGDPADPEGEATLYEGAATRDLGLGGGVQVVLGVRLGKGHAAPATPPPASGAAPGAARCAEASAGGWPMGVSIFFEGGYALMSDVHFRDAGALDVGGMRLQGGVTGHF